MKLYSFFGIILGITLIGLINGEVDFCLEFDSNYVSENKGSLQEISVLRKQVDQEIENIVREAALTFKADTANYSNFQLNLSHPAITLQGNFSHVLTLIDDQIIRLWTLKEEGLEIFNLTFPLIFMNGSYQADGYVGATRLFDIYGEGTFHLNMYNLSVSAVTGLIVNSSALCIPFMIDVYLKDFKSNFIHFMDGDEELEPLLNHTIELLVPEAVRIMFGENRDKADPYIQAIINKILNGSNSQTLSKLLYILAKNKNQLSSIL